MWLIKRPNIRIGLLVSYVAAVFSNRAKGRSQLSWGLRLHSWADICTYSQWLLHFHHMDGAVVKGDGFHIEGLSHRLHVQAVRFLLHYHTSACKTAEGEWIRLAYVYVYGVCVSLRMTHWSELFRWYFFVPYQAAAFVSNEKGRKWFVCQQLCVCMN